MRVTDGHTNWRCAAVVKDARNNGRIRVRCRDEAELQQVKDIAQKTMVSGTSARIHPSTHTKGKACTLRKKKLIWKIG
jgi:hypothetical protein